MVRTFTTYQGQLHCEIKHEPSGRNLETDAPVDNNGKGESFSPTDLVGAALGSCILTTIAMVADRDGVSIENAKAVVEKHMTDKPRKIGELRLTITMPKALTPQLRKKYEEVAHHCPVHRSLDPAMKIPMTFLYE